MMEMTTETTDCRPVVVHLVEQKAMANGKVVPHDTPYPEQNTVIGSAEVSLTVYTPHNAQFGVHSTQYMTSCRLSI